jgi:hypothetical protein
MTESTVTYARVTGGIQGRVFNEDKPGEFYVETRATETNSGEITNKFRVYWTGETDGQEMLCAEFGYRDQTSYTSTKKEKAWRFDYLYEMTRRTTTGPWGSHASVRTLIGQGTQGLVLSESSSGGNSIDDGGAVADSFMGPGHGCIWEIEPARLLLDGVVTDYSKYGRHKARRVSFQTKSNYYRNRSGNLLTGTGPETFARSPVARVDRHWEFENGQIRFWDRAVFLQKLTGGAQHATTVIPDIYTHLTRKADEVRRVAIVDHIGNSGAESEPIERNNCLAVEYDGANGSLLVETQQVRRWASGNYLKPANLVNFGLYSTTLKTGAGVEPKTYFNYGGTLNGSNYEFAIGDTVEMEGRIVANMKRDNPA